MNRKVAKGPPISNPLKSKRKHLESHGLLLSAVKWNTKLNLKFPFLHKFYLFQKIEKKLSVKMIIRLTRYEACRSNPKSRSSILSPHIHLPQELHLYLSTTNKSILRVWYNLWKKADGSKIHGRHSPPPPLGQSHKNKCWESWDVHQNYPHLKR